MKSINFYQKNHGLWRLLGILVFFLSSNLVSAADRSTPFTPGETLDPGTELEACGPFDDNCFPALYEPPATDGTSGQVLTTDGAGNLSWTTPASSQWTTSGSNIYYNTGNVGIGTTDPGAKLTIDGSTQDALRIYATDINNYYRIGRDISNGLLYFYGNQSGENGYVFSGGNGERMRIDTNGNVGIGTTSPVAKFSVAGNTYVGGNITATGTLTLGTSLVVGTSGNFINNTSLTLSSGSYATWSSRGTIVWPSNGVMRLTNALETDFNRLQFGGTTSAFPSIKRNGAGLDFRLADDSDYATTTAQGGIFNGSVGVGTTNPQGKLHVAGVAGSGQLQIQDTAGLGLNATILIPFLDSAGDRQAYIYKEPTTGKFGIWNSQSSAITTINDVLNIKNSNVGIGTTDPVAKLDVRGDQIIYSANAGYTEGLSVFTTGSPVSGGGVNLHNGSAGTAPGLTTLKGFLRVIPSGDIRLRSYGANNLSLGTNDADRLTINSSGNVGIGTTTPSAKLSVNGDSYFGGNVTATGALNVATSITVGTNGNFINNTSFNLASGSYAT